MQQLFLDAPRQLSLLNEPIPKAGPGELVLKIQAAITCGTDLKTYRRGHPKFPMPTLMGHEFSGDVYEVGEGVTKFSKGQPIMIAPTTPCEREDCMCCKRGFGNLCNYTMETMMLGGFAEYIRVPAHIVPVNVFHKPENLDYWEASALEPLSCVVYGQQHLRMGEKDTVVIIGSGPIGLLYLMTSKLRKAKKIIVIGRREMRLKAARELGADVVIEDSNDPEQVLEKVLEATNGRGADVVVECTGQPKVWENSFKFVKRGGQVMLFGGCSSGTQINMPMKQIMQDGLSVQGVFHFTPDAVHEAAKILSSGKLNITRLITEKRGLSEYKDIFATLEKGDAIKIGIIPWE